MTIDTKKAVWQVYSNRLRASKVCKMDIDSLQWSPLIVWIIYKWEISLGLPILVRKSLEDR